VHIVVEFALVLHIGLEQAVVGILEVGTGIGCLFVVGCILQVDKLLWYCIPCTLLLM
jgi:hypothetical protein